MTDFVLQKRLAAIFRVVWLLPFLGGGGALAIAIRHYLHVSWAGTLLGVGALGVAIRRLTYKSSDSVMKHVSLEGKVAFVTGANTGIGLETTIWLAGAGAHVILACRSQERAEAAMRKARARYPNKNLQLTFLPLDLGDFRSVCLCAQAFIRLNLPLHILILNGGLADPSKGTTKEGMEMHFGVNHFGHFALLYLLLDPLRQTSKESKHPSRVIVVASESHRQTYKPVLDLHKLWTHDPSFKKHFFLELYGQSKLANMLFAKELHLRYGKEFDTFSLHPGSLVATDISRWSIFAVLGMKIISLWTRNINQATATTLYCATDEKLTGKGGGYYRGCALAKEADNAKDESQARLLWEESENYFHKLTKKYESSN